MAFRLPALAGLAAALWPGIAATSPPPRTASARPAPPPAACTMHWTASSGGLWSDAASWTEQRVPQRTDHVCIQAPGTYTVRLTEYAEMTSLTVGGTESTPTLLLDQSGHGGFMVLDSLFVEPSGALVLDGGGIQLYEKATVAGTWEMRNRAYWYGDAVVRVSGRLSVARATLGYWAGKQLDVSGRLELHPRSFLEVRARGTDATKTALAPALPTPSPDTTLPALHLRAAGELRLVWGDTLAADVSGRVVVIGDAVVDGGLAVERGANTQLSDGDEYPFLGMRWHTLQGGFTRTSGLNDPARGLALAIGQGHSPTETMQLVLRAGPPRALQSLTDVQPALVASGAPRLLRLRGQGLHAPMEAWLDCLACQQPGLFARIDGRMQAGGDTTGTAAFDLSDPRIAGSYRLTLRDAGGATASLPVAITSGPLRLSIRLLDAETTEGSSRVARAVVRNTWAPYEAHPVALQVGGTATLHKDYGMDVLPGELVLPRGQDSVVVSVFALRDDIDEGAETVTLTIPDAAYATGQATLVIHDAPAGATPYAAAVSPTRLGVGGRATVRLVGEALTDDLTVQLVGADGAPLAATALRSDPDGRALHATFDLRPSTAPSPDVLTPGPRRVLVRVAGGAEVASLPVVLARPDVPNVSVSLDLPPRILRGRPTPVTLVVRNLGNVDVTGSPLLLGVPAGTEWTHDPSGLTLPAGATWAGLWPSQATAEQTQTIRLPFMRLPAGATRRLDVFLAFPAPLSARLAAAWESH